MDPDTLLSRIVAIKVRVYFQLFFRQCIRGGISSNY